MAPASRASLVVALAAFSVGGQPPGQVNYSVDVASQQPISRFIYGINFAESKEAWGGEVPRGITLNRMGGNRLTAYNWENNASNCGNDCNGTFPNDGYLGGGDVPGEAVRYRAEWAATHQAAFLATIPILGFVAKDKAGSVPLTLPLEERRGSRFLPSKARKGSGFSARPNQADGVVYQDEFAAFLERNFKATRSQRETPIWYSLDNEPDIWGSTHEALRGNCSGPGNCVLTGYDELAKAGAEYASAVKDVAPDALVFGPVLTNWNGFTNLFHNNVADPAGRQFYLEYYLDRMRQAEVEQGRRLLDVLDVHWYAEALSTRSQSVANEWADQDSTMIQARVQSPRSLWDPTYQERSWVTGVTRKPIRLIPRLREMIAAHYPGTRIAITEYFYHRGGDISGAIAQADALGVFGREGVFAATLWPQGSQWAYQGNMQQTYACVFAAFRAFRDFDGRGGSFGDVSLKVVNPDVERTSLYASLDSRQPGRVILMAINKSEADVDAAVSINGTQGMGNVEVWQIVGGKGRCAGPQRSAQAARLEGRVVRVALPALSVSTIVITG